MSSTRLSAAPSVIQRAPREWNGVIHTRMHRAWPLAKLAIAMLANVAWIGLVVYWLSALF